MNTLNLRKIAFQALAVCLCAASGLSATIHDRTQKLTPVATDKVAVSDSQDGDKTKGVQLGNLPVSTPTQNALDAQGNLDVVNGSLSGAGILTLTLKGDGNGGYAVHFNTSAFTDIVFSNNQISGNRLDGKLVNAPADMSSQVTFCESADVDSAEDITTGGAVNITTGTCQDAWGGTPIQGS